MKYAHKIEFGYCYHLDKINVIVHPKGITLKRGLGIVTQKQKLWIN